MPIFKSTYNILVTPWEDEVFDPNWMDSDKLVLPPTKPWDYSRPLQIEDVDIWEVIFEGGGGFGLYAAWSPFAEFYMLRVGSFLEQKGHGVETYYGPGVQKHLQARIKELNIPITINKVWVEPEDMWLYEEVDTKASTLILP